MQRLFSIGLSCLISCIIISGCKTPQEKIIGIYDIDSNKGCTYCHNYAPKSMVFENLDLQSGSLRYYRCEFSNGTMHSGHFDFLHVDSCLKLILYPDSGSVEFYGILNTFQQTEYRITSKKIRERCDGLFSNCVWIKRND